MYIHILYASSVSVAPPPILQVRVAPSSRNSAWAAFDGRNRKEIKQGDRSGATSPSHCIHTCPYRSQLQNGSFKEYNELRSDYSLRDNIAYCAFAYMYFSSLLVSTCSVVVTTSPCPVPTINNTGHVTDWFDSLAECLHWNVRKQQKKL